MSVVLRLVAFVVIPLLLLPATVRAQKTVLPKYEETLVGVAKSDRFWTRRIDVRLFQETLTAQRMAHVTYSEFYWPTFESRSMECLVDGEHVRFRHSAGKLVELSVNVTLDPTAPGCSAWGDWLPGPKMVEVTMAPSGEWDQQARSTISGQTGGLQWRFNEASFVWHVRAMGLVGEGYSFDGATGSASTLHQTQMGETQ